MVIIPRWSGELVSAPVSGNGPNDRPGLGVSVDEKQLTFIEAMTEGTPGPTYLRPDGSPTHW
jgi:hypothetical protein